MGLKGHSAQPEGASRHVGRSEELPSAVALTARWWGLTRATCHSVSTPATPRPQSINTLASGHRAQPFTARLHGFIQKHVQPVVRMSECCTWPDAGTAPGAPPPSWPLLYTASQGVYVWGLPPPPAGLGLRSPEAPSPYLSPLGSPRSGCREHSRNECPALLPRAVLPGDQTPSHAVPQERVAPQSVFLPCPESARRGSNHRNDGVSRDAHGSVRGRVLTVLLSPCHLSNAAFLPGWTLLCKLTLSSR